MCDTMVKISDSGVLFAKNSDRDPNEAQIIDWIPARIHQPGARVRCTWLDIPQVSSTRAVMLSRPWWMWGAEIGANDAHVVIGNEAVFTRRRNRHRAEGPGLLGMDMIRLALERSSSASDAVQVIVTLLELHGQDGPCSHDHPAFTYDNSFLIADPASAYVVETAGRSWVSDEVQPGTSRTLSNALSIPEFAKRNGDFVKTSVSRARARQRCTLASTSAASDALGMMAGLRSHGGSSLPRYSPVNGAMSGPCMHAGGLAANSQTTSSWVSDLRDTPIHWITATAAPCTSIFKPAHVDVPVDLGPAPTNRFDDRCLWWRHEVLHRLVARDIGGYLPRFAAARDRVERSWLDAPPDSETAFMIAAELEEAWLRDIRAAHLAETRPTWTKAYWAIQSSRAQMKERIREGAVVSVSDV